MKKPLSLQSLVARNISKFVSKENKDLLLIIEKWEDIVGKSFSKGVFPKFIKGKTLHIAASSPAFSSQIRYIEDGIITRLSKFVSSKRIEKLKTHYTQGEFSEGTGSVVRDDNNTPSTNYCSEKIPLGIDEAVKKSLLNFSKNIKR